MALEILDIQPRELKFLFELKKQSSCTVRLVNNFSDYVAFKVKTTSPKKYCVRPNVGIIKPNSFCDFNVTMQAPKVAPPDMMCKDKFLVQSTVVPVGTSEDDITSYTFSRDGGRYVEEVKLRVILLSPPNSPILSPINPIIKQDPVQKVFTPEDHLIHKLGHAPQINLVSEDVVETKVNDSEVAKPAEDVKYKPVKEVEDQSEYVNIESKKEFEDLSKYMVYETVKGNEDPTKKGDYKLLDLLNDEEDLTENEHYKIQNHVENEDDLKKNENTRTWDHVTYEVDPRKDVEYEALKTMKHLEQPLKDVTKTINEAKEPTQNAEYSTMDDVEVAEQGLHQTAAKVNDEAKLVKDVEEMKSKLNVLESKLTEAKITISKLTEERRWTGQERETLRQELVVLRSKRADKKVQVGFPFLFVCMVSLAGVVLGYTLRC